jgi:protein-disulfide isomerase
VPPRLLGAIALVLASLLLVAACGGDDTDPEGVEEAQAAFEGIPASGATVGEQDAPVEVVEYLDVQCPACKSAAEDVVPDLLDEQVRTGKIRLTARPIQVIGPASTLGARGAAAAGEQDAAWPFIDTLFRNQGPGESGWLNEELMRNVADELGLDVDAWDEALRGSSEQVVAADLAKAREDQVPGVPYFVVSGPGGTEQVADATVENVVAAIESVSGRAGQ